MTWWSVVDMDDEVNNGRMVDGGWTNEIQGGVDPLVNIAILEARP
jgi:hypothetical protein